MDAAQFAVVAGPRAKVARHAGRPRHRRRARRGDSHTGPAVVQAPACRPPSRPSADRFQPLAAVSVGRRRRRRVISHVRLSHGAAGHVPGRVQDAAQGADQDAADVRHSPAVQRVAGVLHHRPGRRWRPPADDEKRGRTTAAAATAAAARVVRVRTLVVVLVHAEDHAQVHTQEQKPGHVRVPAGRREAQKLPLTQPCARRHLFELTAVTLYRVVRSGRL